jgi:hypothetical protein
MFACPSQRNTVTDSEPGKVHVGLNPERFSSEVSHRIPGSLNARSGCSLSKPDFQW